MLYYMNSDTGKVIAREIDDPPYGGLWFEISEEEYKEALHPLSNRKATEEEENTNPYLLTGEELARTEQRRKAGLK